MGRSSRSPRAVVDDVLDPGGFRQGVHLMHGCDAVCFELPSVKTVVGLLGSSPARMTMEFLPVRVSTMP